MFKGSSTSSRAAAVPPELAMSTPPQGVAAAMSARQQSNIGPQSVMEDRGMPGIGGAPSPSPSMYVNNAPGSAAPEREYIPSDSSGQQSPLAVMRPKQMTV